MELDPVRICCGQRHQGVACLDDLVMCCLCFGRFVITELIQNLYGQRVDICKYCDALEPPRTERFTNTTGKWRPSHA